MKLLTPREQSAVQAHVSGIMAILGGDDGVVTIITATTTAEHRDELRRILFERHQEDVYDPKLFGVHRLPASAAASARATDRSGATETVTDADARAAVPAEALQPSFDQVRPDAVMRVDVAMLTRALATWDEESKDKGWADRTDEERHADNARYLMGIMLEHATWPIRDAICQAIDVGVLRGISAVQLGGDGTQRLEYATATIGTCDTEIERMVDRLQKTGGSIEIRIDQPLA